MKVKIQAMYKGLKEQLEVYLEKLAPFLEMEIAQLSKIKKGIRQLKREQIPIISEILKASADELMTLWLADQIYAVVKDEKLALQALTVNEDEVKKQNKKLKK